MRRVVGMVASLVILAACEGGRSLSFAHPYSLDMSPPQGSPLFQKAWKEGCESGLSGLGNQFVKVFYEFQYDPNLATNTLYNRTWEVSNMYCRTFAFVSDERASNKSFRQHFDGE